MAAVTWNGNAVGDGDVVVEERISKLPKVVLSGAGIVGDPSIEAYTVRRGLLRTDDADTNDRRIDVTWESVTEARYMIQIGTLTNAGNLPRAGVVSGTLAVVGGATIAVKRVDSVRITTGVGAELVVIES